ncbi:MAG: glycosyltransferase [Dehalococcoidia bacterium]
MNSDADNLDINSSVKKHILTLLDHISKYKKHSAIIIEQKDAQIARLADAVDKRDALITELVAKTSQISQLTTMVNEKNSALIDLDFTLKDRDTEINMMRSTIVFQMASRYQSIVNKVFPASSGIRRLYELVMRGLRVILNKGGMVFFREAAKYLISEKPSADNAVSGALQLIESSGKHLDIIIPVYNSFEHVQKCISSVLSCTSEIPFTIVIVDDCSTDNSLKEYLSYLVAKQADIKILKNKKNAGYLKSVNRGMKYSRNDVVLLNSDTVVTHGWLRELRDCAYGSERIATVTPMSNNATICSVPDFCKSNEIPHGYSIQEFASLVNKTAVSNGVRHYEIPVGIGYCMYVKRKVLHDIGYFDEAFGRGYEEEVDFCLRALEHGYKNVACPQVFIYHAGSASIDEGQKTALEKKNWGLLIKRHPQYTSILADFTSKNPMSGLQQAIKDNIEKRSLGGLKIGLDAQLLIRPQWTGSERYIDSLIRGILWDDANNHYTVFSANDKYDDRFYDGSNIVRKYAADSADILWDPDYKGLDVFHRPFQCHGALDLLALAGARCRVLTILDLILYKRPDYQQKKEDHERYQRIMNVSAKLADRIIAISEFCKKDIVETLGIDPEKIDVIYPVTFDPAKLEKVDNGLSRQALKDKYGISGKFIMYIGTTFPHKNQEGLILAYELLLNKYAAKQEQIPDLVLVGPDTALQTKKRLVDRTKHITHKVKLIEYVPDEDMPAFYSCAELFVFPSLYEGFGIPLIEAMAYGLPIVASNATSVPEVVGDAALVVDCTRADLLADAIETVLNDAGIRERLVERSRERIKQFSMETVIKQTLNTYETARLSVCQRPRELSAEIKADIIKLAAEAKADFFLNEYEKKEMG